MGRKAFLLFLFLFSLFIRSIFFLIFLEKDNKFLVCTDSAEYHNIAVNIVEGKGIRKVNEDLNFRRLPGYSIFLAVCYKIFGKNIIKALWIQIILSCLIPIFIFYLSLIFFPYNFFLAKFVSIYSTIYLGFVLHSGMALSDSFFLICFLLFSILFLSSFDLFFYKKNYHHFYLKKFFFSGILLGISSIIRPVGQYLIVLSLILLIFSNFDIFDKIKSIFVLFVGWMMIVFWWLLRNFIFTGFLFFHTLPGIHFLIYSAAYVDMELNNCNYYQSKKKLMKEWEYEIFQKEKEWGRKLNDIESCYIAEKISFDYIKKSPLIFLKHSLIHMMKTFFGLYSSTLLFVTLGKLPNYDKNITLVDKVKRFLWPKASNKFVTIIIYLEILLLIVTIFGFIGFVVISLLKKSVLNIVFKVLPFIGLFIFVTLAYGCARLRLPIEPFFIILAFYFWLEVVCGKFFKKGKRNAFH